MLSSKVDELQDYSKVTVEALERLESRSESLSIPDHIVSSTSPDLSDISSQLSRIESLISSDYQASIKGGSSPGGLPRIVPSGSRSPSRGHSSSSTHESRRNSFSSFGAPVTEFPSISPSEYTVASFVGHGHLQPRHRFQCECCPAPTLFDSKEKLQYVAINKCY